MRIKRIKLENFRNLTGLDQVIDQDFVVLVGKNGSGKTNFLESIFYSSLLLAFPPNKSWELIAFDADYFRIKLEVDDKNLEYYYGRKNERQYQRSQTWDGAKKRASDMLGVLPSVAFLPQDLNLLQLSPSLRREYLDDVLLQTEKGYEEALTEYVKVVRQRNELLAKIRERGASPEDLDFWDDKLIELSKILVSARSHFAEYVNTDLPTLYKELTGAGKNISFEYRPSAGKDIDVLASSLLEWRSRDIASAKTGLGPHRDDWQVVDESGRNLSHFLSRGEQRSIIICLKLKEFRYIDQEIEEKPIMLLDELLAELDEERGKQMLAGLPQDTQVFLTATSLSGISEEILKKSQIIEM